jgi:hypothetical protein
MAPNAHEKFNGYSRTPSPAHILSQLGSTSSHAWQGDKAYHHSIPNKQNIPPVCTAVQTFIKLTKLQIFIFYFCKSSSKSQVLSLKYRRGKHDDHHPALLKLSKTKSAN